MSFSRVIKLFMSILFVQVCLNSFCKGTSNVDFKQPDGHLNNPKIVCYLDTRVMEIAYTFTMDPTDVDPHLCTHIIYAFGKITYTTHEVSDHLVPVRGEISGFFVNVTQKTVALKKINKDLKVLFSIGGWNYDSQAFRKMIANESARDTFIQSILALLQKYELDGLDIYTENPSNMGDLISLEDKSYLIPFCQELKRAFAPYNLMLTAALAGNLNAVQGSVRVMRELSKSLDFISIMAYDLHGAWENVTVHHSPLYKPENEKDHQLSIDLVVKQWVETGIPKEKMLLGLASYGRTYAVKDTNDRCPLPGSPIVCPAPGNLFTKKSGFIAYYEVCKNIFNRKWIYKWLDDEKVPYVFSNHVDPPSHKWLDNGPILKWAAFDDVRSFDYKVKYFMQTGLGGVMFFSLDNDAYYGHYCGQPSFPLLRVINFYLNKKIQVEYPDPDKVFNMTKAFVQSEEREKYLNKYFTDFDPSANNSKAINSFCDCKKGLYTVKIADSFSLNRTITFDCNIPAIVSTSQIDESEMKENVIMVGFQTKKQQQRILTGYDEYLQLNHSQRFEGKLTMMLMIAASFALIIHLFG